MAEHDVTATSDTAEPTGWRRFWLPLRKVFGGRSTPTGGTGTAPAPAEPDPEAVEAGVTVQPAETARAEETTPSARGTEEVQDPRDDASFPAEFAAYAHSGDRPPRYSPEPSAPATLDGEVEGILIHDSVIDGFTAGRLTVRAASVRGDSHRFGGAPRQDAVAVTLLGDLDDGIVVGVVADGVGSARLSHRGATTACTAAVTAMKARTDILRDALRDGDADRLRYEIDHIVDEVADQIVVAAERLGAEPAAFATTLRVVMAPTTATMWRAAFNVGDGETYRLAKAGWRTVRMATKSVSGNKLHSTAVDALPVRKFAVKFDHWKADPNEVVVVCTDGLSEPLRDKEFAAHLRDEWATETTPGTLRFLWQMQSRLRSYDDDRAVVCIWDQERNTSLQAE